MPTHLLMKKDIIKNPTAASTAAGFFDYDKED
jgi:hypothetical protein